MARWLGIWLITLTASIVLSSVHAGDTKKGKLDADAIFKKLDANHDGILNKMEFLRLADQFKDKTKAREKLTMVYAQIDPDNKGLSKVQFKTYLDSKKKKDEKQ